MKKAIILIAVVALSACQTTQQRQQDGRAQADKVVRAVFGTVKPLPVDPNCSWCLVARRCKVPTCPNQNEQKQ
jgi:hypothetical protein